MKQRLLLLYALSLCALCCAAAPPLRFRHLTVDNGLPSNCITGFLQDAQGFLWVNTQSGLCRYDGVEFEPLVLPDSLSLGLPMNDFCLSPDGELWMGGRQGLVRCRPGLMECEPVPLALPDGTPCTPWVLKMAADSSHLWIAAADRRVYRYELATGRFSLCPFTEEFTSIEYIYIDSYGSVWVLAYGATGIYRWDGDRLCFRPFHLNVRGAGGELLGRQVNFLQLYEDAAHNFWVTSWNQGLFRINRSTHEAHCELPVSQRNGLTHTHCIGEWGDGRLLMGSDDGLTYYDRRSGEVLLYTAGEEAGSLSDGFVYSIFADSEGGLWVGSYYGGANYMPAGLKNFRGFAQSKHRNSVSGNVISRFCEDGEGNLWIGTDDGGLSCYRIDEGRFYSVAPPDGENLNVHALCLDGERLWMGTYDGGLYTVDTRTRHIAPYSDRSFELRSVYAVYKAQNGDLWLGTMNSIMRMRPGESRFAKVRDAASVVIGMREDAAGNLWVATQGDGLYKYTPGDSLWSEFRQGAIPSNVVNCLCFDEGGQLWVGTEAGLCRHHAADDSFETLNLNVGGRGIAAIVEGAHSLWLATTRGLVELDSQGGTLCYTKEEGLQSNVFVVDAGLRTSRGEICLGTANGFNLFHPAEIGRNKVVPPVVINQIEVNNRRLSPRPAALSGDAPAIELSYDQNTIAISYAALSYSSPQRNSYAYKLEGIDRDWVHVGNQTKVYFSRLPAGRYTFCVKGANNDGVWNEQGATLGIVINPPLYRSPLFVALYIVLLLFVLIFGIYRYQIYARRKHLNELRRVEREKEKEMDRARVDFFTTIAHEIKTPVSLIVAPLEKILKSQEALSPSLRNDLQVMQRNSTQLLFMVNQFLDFRRIEKNHYKVRLRNGRIYPLLCAAAERFSASFAQRGIELSLVCNDKEGEAMVDAEALNIALGNLLSNAAKYTRDRVEVACNFFARANTLQITVADNGEGFSAAECEKIFRPFYQIVENRRRGTGIGLTIVKRYIEAMGGRVSVNSAQGSGTTFTLALPIRQQPQGEPAPADEQPQPADEGSVSRNIVGESSPAADGAERPGLLIVEDNEEMLSFLASNFADDYIVTVAHDGREALNLLGENGDVSLVISDLMMPQMDGLAFCRAVRESMFLCHLPIILLTAKSDMPSKVQGMESGADLFIEKPFSVEYLRACVRNLIELRKMVWLKYKKMPNVSLTTVSSNGYDVDFLNRLNQIIEENFSNPDMSVEFLADKLCISRSKLFVKIKSLTQCTPNELIQVVRLKKAAALLIENRYRINEICYMVGFNNHSYFSKCFQKQFGVKPQEFYKSKRAEEEENAAQETKTK